MAIRVRGELAQSFGREVRKRSFSASEANGALHRSARIERCRHIGQCVEARAIVVHAAWYVGPEMVRDHGKLGRSEGCFAVSENDLAVMLDRLGAGRLIYADKV